MLALHCCVAAANSMPVIEVSENGTLVRQFTVLQTSSVSLVTSDADNDLVTVYSWTTLPPGSSLSQVGSSATFEWTPMNMDPVELT